MRHIVWTEAEKYPIALLIKASGFNARELGNNYITPLESKGVQSSDVIAFTLDYNSSGKAPAGHIKEYLKNLLPGLQGLGVQYLYVADSNYFKVLAGKPKADPYFGYVLPCKIKGYEHMNVVLGLNHSALIYNPDLQAKLDLSLETLASAIKGTYQPLGQNIIHSAHYPEGPQAIQEALEALHQYPSLTCDIEAFSLRFNEAGIGTITFCWDEHNGMAFACDYKTYAERPDEGFHGWQGVNHEVRALIKDFLTTYKGRITFHHAPYDAKVLIYTLWMKDGLDTEGLLEGLDILTRDMDDTKIIAYLATNSTAGNVLGLKALAHEFAGNWAIEEIKDIRKVPLPELLQYNLVDGLSTHYVRDKYYPIMVADQQEELYNSLFKDSLKLILQLELTGMPLNPTRVKEVKAQLEEVRDAQIEVLVNSPVIQALNLLLQESAMEKANAKLKVKQHPLQKFSDTVLNPHSPKQLQRLLYEQMGLPVLDYTDTKQPATGAETLKKLINHTQEPAYKAILEALIIHAGVDKILTTFIPAFEAAIEKGDGIWWLHGSFNLGGAVSGRLSSSDPNLQNIPANVEIKIGGIKIELGKLIKSCFSAPPDWLFGGADFNSLEDYVSALTTRDPNKLIIYEQGLDSHAFRAISYYGEQMPDIRLSNGRRVFQINQAGGCYTLMEGDEILLPSGETITVEQYYETSSFS